MWKMYSINLTYCIIIIIIISIIIIIIIINVAVIISSLYSKFIIIDIKKIHFIINTITDSIHIRCSD